MLLWHSNNAGAFAIRQLQANLNFSWFVRIPVFQEISINTTLSVCSSFLLWVFSLYSLSVGLYVYILCLYLYLSLISAADSGSGIDFLLFDHVQECNENFSFWTACNFSKCVNHHLRLTENCAYLIISSLSCAEISQWRFSLISVKTQGLMSAPRAIMMPSTCHIRFIILFE